MTDREASTAMRDDRRDPMAPRDTLNARLTAVFLALVVAIPVLGVLWYWLNTELAWWDRRLDEAYLVGAILVIAAIAFLSPGFFPAAIWQIRQGMLRVWHRWIGR